MTLLFPVADYAHDFLVSIYTKQKEALWRYLYRGVSLDDADLTVSFDAFDTLITRPWFKPSDQFAAITHELRGLGLFYDSAKNWMLLRQHSESEAHDRAAEEEISLLEIYSVIAERLNWSPGQLDQAYRVEVAREMKDIRPIAYAVERANTLLELGRDVIVTSDTYFSSVQLAALLGRCGCNIPLNSIFASSDHGVTKRTGNLFKTILQSRKLLPGQLCHVGDQPVADGRSPSNLGIRGNIWCDFLPTRYEKLFAYENDRYFLMCSAFAGCARTSRLSQTFGNSNSQAAWSVGCNVAGPVLFSYVFWVLWRARDLGLNRLYFLARDGDILLSIARKICLWQNWDIDCRYLFASRQSFAFAALTKIDESALQWVVDWSETPTLRVILKRLTVSPCEVIEELIQGGFSKSDWDRGLSDNEVKALIEVLKADRPSQLILGRARQDREILLDYLRQAGLVDGMRWAICDVGWRGLIQSSLDKLTSTNPEFPKDFVGFYFGLNTEGLLIQRSRADAFQPGNMSWAAWIMDLFCAAEHGSVMRFERNGDGSVCPVLASVATLNSRARSIVIQRNAILTFVDEVIKTLEPTLVSGDDSLSVLKTRSLTALRLFLRRPSIDEAEAYGGLELEIGATHDTAITIAPILTLTDILRQLLPWGAPRANIYWPEASVQRSVTSISLRYLLYSIQRTRAWIASGGRWIKEHVSWRMR